MILAALHRMLGRLLLKLMVVAGHALRRHREHLLLPLPVDRGLAPILLHWIHLCLYVAPLLPDLLRRAAHVVIHAQGAPALDRAHSSSGRPPVRRDGSLA